MFSVIVIAAVAALIVGVALNVLVIATVITELLRKIELIEV